MIDLQWKAENASQFELQAKSTQGAGEFITRYQGVDHSSVLSGLAEGTHEFRVRAIDADGNTSAWSQTLLVEVAYMPASRVRLLMLLGGLVVLMTVISILHGHFSHRRKEAEA